ncbi:hypothetical protein T310_10290, partial [Rasamsonia emersonii CBS 393.64]
VIQGFLRNRRRVHGQLFLVRQVSLKPIKIRLSRSSEYSGVRTGVRCLHCSTCTEDIRPLSPIICFADLLLIISNRTAKVATLKLSGRLCFAPPGDRSGYRYTDACVARNLHESP